MAYCAIDQAKTERMKMSEDTINNLLEEYKEAETSEEVDMLTKTNKARGFFNEALQAAHDEAMERTKDALPVVQPTAETDELRGRLAQMMAQVAELSKALGVPVPTKAVAAPRLKLTRPGNTYRLLSTDVKWASTPQIHALMKIVSAHVEVGEVVAEEEIVKAVVANEELLCTNQGGKRIWDYYKGSHAKGLLAHGNIEKV